MEQGWNHRCGGTSVHPEKYSVCGWVPTSSNPQMSSVHKWRAIELQGVHRGAACGSQSHNQKAAALPGKVIVPVLRVGIEQTYHHATFRVQGSNAITLEQIAAPTGQTKVVENRSAAQGLGKDMIDGKVDANNVFRGQAITTAMARSIGNGLAKRLGNVGASHGDEGG